MTWVFDSDKDQCGKQRVWAERGFKVRVEFIMGVGIEGRPRLGKDAGILFRRVAHCLHFRDPGQSHQAERTHREAWMACWTPYPCGSGWALKW